MKRKINSVCVSLDNEEVRKLTKCLGNCFICNRYDAKTRVCSAATLWIEFPMFVQDDCLPDFDNQSEINLDLQTLTC